MSKFLLKIPKYLFLLMLTGLNLLSVAAMNVCAYSSWLRPQVHPNVSFLGLLFPFTLAATLVFIPVWFILGILGMRIDGGGRRRSAYWGTLISLAGMLCCASSIRTYCPLNFPSEAPDGALKVLSYNVFSLSNPDKLPWEEHPVICYLNDCEADIACLQEVGALRRKEVEPLVAEKYPYRHFDVVHGSTYACLSRFPIVGMQVIDFKSNTNGAVAYDIVTDRGDTLCVLNLHLESYKLRESDREEYRDLIRNHDKDHVRHNVLSLRKKLIAANPIRGRQTDAVAAFIEQCPRRYIICCGDFNDAPISYTHHRLTRLLDDAYTRSGNGPGLSYNRSGMYFRIDHILCSPSMRAYGAVVDNSIDQSDHYPIFAWLELQK